ncbi:MAG: thrombospondin type 3 repeat-containing protein, partial [Phycisphaerae bacterium]
MESGRSGVRKKMGVTCVVLASLFFPPDALAQRGAPVPGKSPRPLQLQAGALQQIAAMEAEKASWTPVQQKITSKLLLASKRSLGQPTVAGLPVLRQTIFPDAAGAVLVDIRADVTDALLARIGALGGQVVSSYPKFNAIRARVPLTQVQALAAEAAVRSIRPADQAVTNLVVSQGDAAHKADQARSTFGVDGTGVKIGVLSDSVDALASLQSSGELPTVTVLPGQSGNPGTSEGTAMLEIVHDLAPGAQLFFATAFSGQASFAQNILDLRAAGCDVIVDDVFYFAEPAFQDGVIAQAVETVVADGAVYFSSAGNSGNLNDGTAGVWEGDFVAIGAPSVIGGTAHDFGGGNNADTITVDPPSLMTLQWSDPSAGSGNDYDLYLLDSSLNTIFDASTAVQNGNDDPFEAISSSGFNDTGTNLVIIRKSGAAARFLRLNTHRGRLAQATAGQVSGHAGAAAAFAVAAVNASSAGGAGGVFDGSESVETFSSDGPRQVFYQSDGTPITPGDFSSTGGSIRPKPDVAAADGVSTATPGFDPFFGTSAAAPHAAAIAGLLKSNDPSLTPAQIRTILTGNTLDIEAGGYDRDSGFGIVDALAALGAGGGCAAPTAVCQNITRSLSGSAVTVTAAEVDNGSTAGSGCVLSSLEIKKTVGGTFGPDVTFTCGDLGPQGVTLRVTQDDGQTAECTATVTVQDTTPPTVACQNITVSLDTSGQASITPADVFQSGSDNCGSVNLVSVVPSSFNCSNVGPNSVTLTVDDGNGNTNTCQATVTVQDIDTDLDGTPDCTDGCPNDPNKIAPGVCGCGVPDTDSDGDGTPDCNDGCPNDPNKTAPGICGCGTPDTDTDGDGVADCLDGCPNDPNKTDPGVCGCGVSDVDSDGDGVPDCIDQCPGAPDIDSDGDGVLDCNDGCPNDPNKTDPGVCGCGVPETDSDGDGTPDCVDGCPIDPAKTAPGQCGCGVPDTDTDGDGTADCNDGCPNDPNKTDPGVCGCGVPDTDSDGDGTPDCNDGCPIDPAKTAPGQCGCGVPDTDTDGDGVADCVDGCPNDPNKTDPGVCGCGVPDTDTDGDGTPDCNDGCPNDPNKIAPGQCGCGVPDTDTDGDGVADCNDGCPNDPNKTTPGVCGCGVPDTDSDGDGVPDCVDGCPIDPDKTDPGVCGCGVPDTDSDGDGVPDCIDQCPGGPDIDTDGDGVLDCNDGCPTDPNKTDPGVCGCGVPDTDSDGDGTPDCNDMCPTDPNKIQPGQCGCGNPDTDSDGDGVADCNDGCPNDPNKTDPGVCGCGTPETDSDGDGTPDCVDGCPLDPNKTSPGQCGCGVPDTDTDNDGTPDCNDGCPNDPNKTAPGQCGCGVPDTDTDGDGVADCNDNCPNDPNKTDPGACGCGVPDTDSDGDGTPDCIDGCPSDPNKT